MKPASTARAAMAALCAALLLAAAAALPAQATSEGLDWSGSLLADLRLGEGGDLGRHELRLELELDAQPGEKSRLFAEAWVRSLGLPRAGTPADLASPEALGPLDLEVPEAWFALYGFPLAATDLRLGRQRISWGRADQISIVDNLNPDDLEDPWGFGRHLGSEAVTLTGYRGPVMLELAYLPIFRPARLSASAAAAMSEVPGRPAGVGTDVSVELPGTGAAGNATLGARLSALLLGWDVAVSWVYGRDDFPVATETVADTPASVAVTLSYPRRHVFSLDLAGELFGLGAWAEAALFRPVDAAQLTDLSALGGPGPASEELEPYVKVLAGLDYTFPGGLYASLQYAHGLFFENRGPDLHDYLLLGLEWKILHDRVRLGPLGAGLEIDDFSRPRDSWALVLTPEVALYPADGVELALGLHWVEGRPGTTFYRQRDSREVYLRGTFSF